MFSVERETALHNQLNVIQPNTSTRGSGITLALKHVSYLHCLCSLV